MPLLAISYLGSAGFRVVADPNVHEPPVDPSDYFRNRTDVLFDS